MQLQYSLITGQFVGKNALFPSLMEVACYLFTFPCNGFIFPIKLGSVIQGLHCGCSCAFWVWFGSAAPRYLGFGTSHLYPYITLEFIPPDVCLLMATF